MRHNRAILAGLSLLAFGAFGIGLGFSWWQWAPSGGSAERELLQRLYAHPWQDARAQPIDLPTLREQIVVLNFWATWCAPCVEEMPELSDLARDFSGKGVQILGIGIDTASNVQQFADKHQIAYPLPVAGAAGLEWLRGLGNTSGGLPYTVVLNRRGEVAGRYLGRIDIRRLREQVRRLAQG